MGSYYVPTARLSYMIPPDASIKFYPLDDFQIYRLDRTRTKSLESFRMPISSYEHLSGRLDADDIGLGWLDGVTVLESVKAVSTRPHAHLHTEVIFCLKGEFSYRIDAVGEASLGAGMGLVIPARTRHALLGDVDTPGKRLGFHLFAQMVSGRRFAIFTSADYANFRNTLLANACRPFKMPSAQIAAVKRLSEFLAPGSAVPSSAEMGLVRLLCCSILYDTVNALSGPPIPVRPQLMEDAVKFLEDHYAERIRIADLVRHIGYGRARLFELFKRHTGLAPNDYLLRFRIRKAQELLAKTTRPVHEVARLVGIPDPGYFSTLFKRQTGHSPASCRQADEASEDAPPPFSKRRLPRP